MTLAEILPIFINILLIILITIGIFLGIKLIITIDKINYLVDDVTKKVKTLDSIFSIFDLVSNKLTFITDKIGTIITSLFEKISGTKKRKEEDFYE